MTTTINIYIYSDSAANLKTTKVMCSVINQCNSFLKIYFNASVIFLRSIIVK